MRKQEAVQFIEEYGKKHFLNDKVKKIRVKTRKNNFYIYATVWDYYNKLWDEVPVARLFWLKGDTYILGYFRHTGRWQSIPHLKGSLKQCLKLIKEDTYGLFWIY